MNAPNIVEGLHTHSNLSSVAGIIVDSKSTQPVLLNFTLGLYSVGLEVFSFQ